MELLSEINRRGTTVLMVTHEHDLVKMFHRRVIEIRDGCVVSDSIMTGDSSTGAYGGSYEIQ